MSAQKVYAFICTRTKNFSDVTKNCLAYLASCGVEVKIMVNQDSIFGGYKKAFDRVNPDPNDIIILCHDDIEFKTPFTSFKSILSKSLGPKTGFVGVGGTTYLDGDLVWWEQERWKQGLHAGCVWHSKDTGEVYETPYGPNRRVVVLDGVFLAARAKILEKVGLEKPDYLKGGWDFYDIHYTLTAHKMGFENKTIPIAIVHHSPGELVGRDSWHINKDLLYNKNEKEFPFIC